MYLFYFTFCIFHYRCNKIKFPQDINPILKTLGQIEDLDILIVRRKGPLSKHYDCIVSRLRLMNYLHYKIRNDKYYSDVKIHLQSVLCLPHQPMDVSSSLHYIKFDKAKSENNDTNIDEFGNDQLETHHSSFIDRISKVECEIEETQNFVKKKSSLSDLQLEWTKLGLSPINENNT